MATETNDNITSKEALEFEERWGFKIDEIYKLALQFYKEKNGGKALTLSYNDRLMLLALTKQISHGKYDPSLVPDNGLFDVIGNSRRRVWESLGDLSKSAAMMRFIKIINSVCPLFASVVEAHKIEKEEKERQIKAELEEKELIAKAKHEEEIKKQEELVQKQIAQELLIRNALNQQTYNQFLSYALLQHPNDKPMQEALISQLQEQHFLQYMQQVYNQQQHGNSAQSPPTQKQLETCDALKVKSSSQSIPPSNGVIPGPKECCSDSHAVESFDQKVDGKVIETNETHSENPTNIMTANNEHQTKVIENTHSDPPASTDVYNIEVASEWSRKDIKSFKESLKAENEAIIKVGSGELVTIRVPTQNGTTLFWEFATDGLDIGFGLSFEWDDIKETQNTEDKQSKERRVDVIIPVARAQSHLEVQCGSHKYPGSGVYLLMFDNSYSLWRSKSIYYRVFYSQ